MNPHVKMFAIGVMYFNTILLTAMFVMAVISPYGWIPVWVGDEAFLEAVIVPMVFLITTLAFVEIYKEYRDYTKGLR